MLILGLETSCDETAAAIVRGGSEVLSSVVASQDDIHAEYRGVVPELASRAHAERVLPVVRRAAADAGIALRQVDAVAVGHRPGLIGSLLVGVSAAKGLAWGLGRPLVGVDHVQAHLYAGLLRAPGEAAPNGPVFPALGLVVSGGHTALYRCDSPVDATRLGATIDDAMGEAFDKAATILGLPYPGGPSIDLLARDGDDRAHEFPVSRLGRDSLDFSFSGLKTSLLYAVRGKPLPGGGFERDHTWLNESSKADLAASFQRAAVAAAIVKLERALDARTPYCSVLAGGGVTANERLRAELAGLCERRALALHMPPRKWCVDNAAMIAGLGCHLLAAGKVAGLELAAVPTTAC